MTKTFDQLIDLANTNLDQAQKLDTFVGSNSYALLTISYAMIAIAQELHRMNEHRAFEVEQRLDLSEARVERLTKLIE